MYETHSLDIDEIPWKDLTHAYGSAEDVPKLIENLTTSNTELFDETMDELFGNIWHQGTVYEATVYALPFLIDILRKGEAIDSSFIATLVALIACGKSYYQVHGKTETVNTFTSADFAQPKNIEVLLDRENEVVDKIRAISIEAIDLLIPYINHESSEVRSAISESFGHFPSQSSKLMPILKSRLVLEEHQDVREFTQESISTFSGS